MQQQQIAEQLVERLAAEREHPDDFVVRMQLEETEDVIRCLWELVGHLGADIGTQGYEYRLLERAREGATHLQAAMLVAARRVQPRDEMAEQRDVHDARERNETG